MKQLLLIPLLVCLLVSPVWAVTTIFNDTCTDTDGDNIDTAHTPDTGTGWTEYLTDGVGQLATYSNACTEETGPSLTRYAYYTADATYSTANYSVSATLGTWTSTAAGRMMGLIGRWQDANNYYLAWIEDSAGTNDIRIYKVVAGVSTQISSTEDTNPTGGDVFKFILNGSSLSLQKNGGNVISPITDTAHSAAGKAGMGAGDFADLTSAASGDGNLTITTFTVETIDGTPAVSQRMMLMGIGQ